MQRTADAATLPALVQQLLTAGWKLSGLDGLPPPERPAEERGQAELVYQGGALRLHRDREDSIYALVVDHSHPDYQQFQMLENNADFLVAHQGKYTSLVRTTPVSQATREELASREWTRAELTALLGEPTSTVHNHGIGTYTVTYVPQGLMFEEAERLKLLNMPAEEIWQQHAKSLVSALTFIDETLENGKPSPDGMFRAGYLEGGGYWSQYIVVRETGKSEVFYHAEYFIQDYFWLDSRRLVYGEVQTTANYLFHVIDVVAETVTDVEVSGPVKEFGPAGDDAIWYRDGDGRTHQVKVP